jgi:hypothetical protein
MLYIMFKRMDYVHKYVSSVLENLQVVSFRDRLLYSWLFASVKHTTELNTMTLSLFEENMFHLTCRLSLYAAILFRKTIQNISNLFLKICFGYCR